MTSRKPSAASGATVSRTTMLVGESTLAETTDTPAPATATVLAPVRKLVFDPVELDVERRLRAAPPSG